MKTEELKAQGFTDEQIAFIMAENGKDVNAVKSELNAVTSDRDTWKSKAETASATLNGYEGKSAEDFKQEIEDWKTKTETLENEYKAKIAERDLNDKVNAKLANLKIKSDMVDVVRADIFKVGVQLNANGDLVGFDEAVASVQEKRPSAFEKEEEDGTKPHFTKKMDGSKPTGKEKLSSMSLDERLKLKNENPELYKSLKS